MKLNCWTQIAQTFYRNPWDAEKLKNLRTGVWSISKEKENYPNRFQGNFRTLRHQVPLQPEIYFETKTFVSVYPWNLFLFFGE